MIFRTLHTFFDVPTTDPTDARRKKLLNILLLGLTVLVLFIMLFSAIADLLNLIGDSDRPGLSLVYISGIFFCAVATGIYYINRRFAGGWASLLFLLLISAMLPFTDTIAEVANGRSLFVFTIPIIIASVLLQPYASFVFAIISTLEVSLLSSLINEVPNIPAIMGFFMVALIAWLSARSLDQALNQLLIINRELDQRVIDRTQALASALARVQAEAGKNQAILEGIVDGVIVFDNTNKAIVANPAIQSLLNLPPETLSGIEIDSLLEMDGLVEREKESVLALLKNPNPVSGNAKIAWGKKTLAISVSPVRTSEGELIGKVAVLHDFTREAEVDRMKSDFVAMVSHELRTPLSSILGYSEMLREGVYGDVSDGQVNAINRIMANTRRLLSIVNDLLDQAQIEAGKLTFHLRDFQPGELLDHLNSVMETIVRAKGLKFETEITPGMPAILVGDPQRLNQVLVNLVNNAVKFTEQGYVKVRLFSPDPNHWAMEVKDSGLGITPEAQKFIFDPFRQANMEVTRQYGGIGLGLSIVKRLVSLMQGEISISSQMGQGSTFTIILPMQSIEQLEPLKERI